MSQLSIEQAVNDGSGSPGEPIVCNACKQGLEETQDNTVVSFGKYLFHVDCFRCAKCHNLVEHDTNLLLLSDGSPVCENCSYICSVCQNPIHNEAIVTGDESYHAECFRCRSCSNKIEELIFAKTTQGIWCMNCHNERVARTRKHAEAKRSRGTRSGGKEKEKSNGEGGTVTGSSSKASGRSKGEREHRERDRDREKSKDSLSTVATTGEGDQGGGGDHTGPIAVRPLPPSPHVGLFANGGSPDPSSSSHRRIKTTPGDAPRHGPSIDLPPSNSAQSLNTFASTSRSTTQNNVHSRTPSSLSSQQNHDPSDSLHRPSLNALRDQPTTRRPSGEHNPSSIDHRSNYGSTSPEPGSGGFRPRQLTSEGGSLSPKLPLESTSRQGSLSAPSGVDKSANRRSGFYGRPSVSEETPRSSSIDHTNAHSTTTTNNDSTTSLSRTPPTPYTPTLPSTASTPPHAPTPPTFPHSDSMPQDLHGSVSFYDPDSLLFLNHIGSTPNSPKNASDHHQKTLPSIVTDGLDPREGDRGGGGESGEEQEHLDQNRIKKSSSNPGGGRRLPSISRRRPSQSGSERGGDDEDDDDEDEGEDGLGPPKSEVARKVRESIQLAKRESDGLGIQSGALDVELVELLLSELEGTKKEMSELQTKYNAFRRASRSAFEGFSMAREEYDKEVAARREAEQEMKALRTKFLEQAKRLAQVDQEQLQQETLKRQSKDLRNSVVGMEKHLSQLRAEVALSTAQVAELAALGKDDQSVPSDRPSSTHAAHDELAEALNSRLEAVKDVHRDEISDLVGQKDDLVREIADLRAIRDTLLEDNAALQNRNADLSEKHSEATRQFDSLQDQTSKLRLLSSPTPTSNGRASHSHSPSSSSLLSNFPSSTANAGRSPLATARVIGSPSELSESFKFVKPEAVEASTRNKFKWGKGKSNQETSRSTPAPPSSTTKSPYIPRQGSVDSSSRQHAFQPVSILRPVRCDYCGDKMWGLNEVRCGLCGSYAHAKCAGYLQGSCHAAGSAGHSNQDDTLNFTPTGPPIFGGDLVVQAKSEGREVPVVVTKCIEAVEAFGMTYEGVYRKTGGMGQTKLITQHFESRQDFDLQDRDKFNDLAAVTSCMKNYFRSLPNPLFTHDLHEEFVAAAELQDLDSRLSALEKALYKLPSIHFQTARVLFEHLHRVQLESVENKMTSANLGVVFGPTVLRSAVASREWSDMGPKAKIVEILCDHADSLFSKSLPAPPVDEA